MRVKGEKEIIGSCKGINQNIMAKPGSLEEFLFERYCLYTLHNNRLRIAYTHHNPWSFRKAKADVISNTLAESYNLGIIDVLQPDFVHMSDGVVVHTYSIEDVVT